MAEQVGMKQQMLFGEHMSAYIPSDAKDVSVVREVPDNQEVFTHPQTDQSLIIEILEAVSGSDQQALKTHFDDIASSNEATQDENAQIESVEQIPGDKVSMHQCSSAWYLCGQQRVAKFNEASRNCVTIHMGLFRLPQYDTDILVTFNDPSNISPSSSSHKAVPTSAQPWTIEQFRQTLSSLTLLNPALFGEDEEAMGY